GLWLLFRCLGRQHGNQIAHRPALMAAFQGRFQRAGRIASLSRSQGVRLGSRRRCDRLGGSRWRFRLSNLADLKDAPTGGVRTADLLPAHAGVQVIKAMTMGTFNGYGHGSLPEKDPSKSLRLILSHVQGS